MPVIALPVLVVSSDLLPDGGPLNGRRSAGQTLLSLWASQAGSNPLTLASGGTELKKGFEQFARSAGHTGLLRLLDLTDPELMVPNGALFLPDPSIGRWSHWRGLAGPASFSLVGQIHTLSTPASMSLIEALATEPVKPWDAVICSSRAGKRVVEAVLEDREQQLLRRFHDESLSWKSERPNLPVIPLPIATQQIQEGLPPKALARKALGIDLNSHALLWLGRLSMLTKFDPWPTYLAIELAARELDKPLVLIECGPDDSQQQADHFEKIRSLCPNVQFCRLGGKKPVSELTKLQSLAAADIAVSLVDNTQETFGLAVAEAMAAGLPIIASDWDGYRDLVRPGIDGFLVPTKWSPIAKELSSALGWGTQLGLLSYPMAAGSLAQLVQVDLPAAVAGIVALLKQPVMIRAMGAAAQLRAEQQFSYKVVMSKYQKLFDKLKERRLAAPLSEFQKQFPPAALDPVRTFSSYPSHKSGAFAKANTENNVPEIVIEGRQPLWNELRRTLPLGRRSVLEKELLAKHQIN